jgi:hypothetical protein
MQFRYASPVYGDDFGGGRLMFEQPGPDLCQNAAFAITPPFGAVGRTWSALRLLPQAMASLGRRAVSLP